VSVCLLGGIDVPLAETFKLHRNVTNRALDAVSLGIVSLNYTQGFQIEPSVESANLLLALRLKETAEQKAKPSSIKQ
jgi:hypothetical protein